MGSCVAVTHSFFFLASMCNMRKITASEWELIKSYTECVKQRAATVNQSCSQLCKPGEICLLWHYGMSVCRREGVWFHTLFLGKRVCPPNSPCFHCISHLRILQHFKKLFELFFRLHKSLRLRIMQLYIGLDQLMCACKLSFEEIPSQLKL